MIFQRFRRFLTGNPRPATEAHQRRQLLLEQLEDRVLFDAVPDGTLELIEEMAKVTPAEVAPVGAESGQTDQNPAQLVSAEILFVDRGVENYQMLLAELVPNRDVEVIYLDEDTDGAVQLADALAGRSGLSAIHIITHGSQAELNLGSATLTTDSMQNEHSATMLAIQQAVGDEGDVLIYGCNFGEGTQGREAAETFAELTGTDIAASDDTTGHRELGGDWDLEVEVGSIEAEAIAASQWQGVLGDAPPILTLDSTASPEVVASDDFESSSVSGGTGWSGDWNLSNTNARLSGGVLLLRDPDRLPVATRAVDLSQYLNPTISFDYTTSNTLDNNDFWQIDYSPDNGVSWINILSGSNDRTGSITDRSLGAVGTDETIFRARFNVGSGNGFDQFRIDNLVFSGEYSGYAMQYLSHAQPVSIVSPNVGIVDSDSANLSGATVTISNPLTGDALNITDALPAGITAAISADGDSVTLSGSASTADYAAALRAIEFSSSSVVEYDRLIEVQVQDELSTTSNLAVTTITVSADPNLIDTDGDGVVNAQDIDDDNDGITDVEEEFAQPVDVLSAVDGAINYSSGPPLVTIWTC